MTGEHVFKPDARPHRDPSPTHGSAHVTRTDDATALAVEVARLYYYQGLTTDAIARELGLSRPKVSRLLTHAKRTGIVEIRIHDPADEPRTLERAIRTTYGLTRVHVVTVPPGATEQDGLTRVAAFTASYLGTLVHSEMTIGLAWGTTLDAVSKHLAPKRTRNVHIVQLNGSGTAEHIGNFHVSEIYTRFGNAYGAGVHLFPVPAFFDHAATKEALWRERAVRRLLELHHRADLLVYSVGSPHSHVPSHVYVGGHLDPADRAELERECVVGDIATVFFRHDGTFRDVPLNARASGPDLSLFQHARQALCVVSGVGKVAALRAALRGGLMTELITDEATARALVSVLHDT